MFHLQSVSGVYTVPGVLPGYERRPTLHEQQVWVMCLGYLTVLLRCCKYILQIQSWISLSFVFCVALTVGKQMLRMWKAG